MNPRFPAVSSLVSGLVFLGFTPIVASAQVDLSYFKGLSARNIGPTGMSGRVGAIDAVDADPRTVYVGAATGGLWKSSDGGLTWKPLTDSLPAASIGAIAIYQPNPDVVWIGTGERNRRNSAGVGTGVYRSLDAGRTWTRMGLEATGAIDAILLDPRDPNTVYVGALGNTWIDGPDRGVYRSTDGGRTWRKVLYVNERTGAGDLVMDPFNPNHLIAGMWEHRRWPWYFQSGGPGSGIYTSYDGGETWKRLSSREGLPEGELGRTGLDFARGKPGVVYALVEATKSALLRSDDGGNTWTIANRTRNIDGRPFYYGQVRVDPTNENRVWIVESPVNQSVDGGKTFTTLLGFAEVHVDHHAFWVGPDGKDLYDGNDGGVYLSRNGGATWRFVENLPFAQFYHIAVDTETPYHVYGGLQDNGSFMGPAVSWHNGGIRPSDWEEVGFGDGMATFVDPADPRYGYTSTQNGDITRFDKRTGERRDIKPAGPEGTPLRFNWNAGMAVDPFDHALYLGSQFLHRTADHGDTWTAISPDLTTNDVTKQMADTSGGLTRDASGAEAFTTIMTIAPSPIERGVIWVGTDDGNVQLTRDGGKTWTNVVGNIKGVPPGTWVPEIRPSRFDAATAFVVFDNHRRGDLAPYLVKTTDYGRTWTSLVTPDLDYFLHAIEQDPGNRDLLYLGSEFGLFLSFDAGKHWQRWSGLPRVPVRGLVVHPGERDLVIATHGRAAWILDDIRPLEAIAANPGIMREALHLFPVPPAFQYEVAQSPGSRFTGWGIFQGENRPYGALLTYAVKEGGDSTKAKIQVLDPGGVAVRTFTGPAHPGINRTAWDLSLDGPRRPGASEQPAGPFGFGGPAALPGSYTIRVIVKSDTVSGPVTVSLDPRLPYTRADRVAKLEALERVMRKQEISFEAVDRLHKATAGIDAVLDRIKGDSSVVMKGLRQSGDSLKKQLKQAEERFTGPETAQGFSGSNETVNSRLGAAYGHLASSGAAPTGTEQTLIQQGERALDAALPALNQALQRVEQYRQRVEAAGIELFKKVEPLGADWRPAPVQ